MEATGYVRGVPDRNNSTAKYTAAVRSSGGLPVAAASAAMATRHSRKSWPRSFISLVFTGNSQSRSIPSKPKVLETSMVELMKAARVAAVEAMRAKRVALLSAPPMEMRVFTGGFLVRSVLVNAVRVVAVVFETSSL